tara:strand:- start:1608 stop:1892 length:285 start_codon:yes stop_codon:yes gene_type:complete
MAAPGNRQEKRPDTLADLRLRISVYIPPSHQALLSSEDKEASSNGRESAGQFSAVSAGNDWTQSRFSAGTAPNPFRSFSPRGIYASFVFVEERN